MADIVKTKQANTVKQITNDQWYLYRVDIEFETPYISPALSPNKAMKKLQLQDILRCYDDDVKELAEHLDRAFMRDSQCNAIIGGHVFTSALREVLNKNNIVVRGVVVIPKDNIRIGTSKVSNSLLIYEYVPAGVTASTLFQVNMQIEEKNLIISIGARKFKGFGKLKLKFEQIKVPDKSK